MGYLIKLHYHPGKQEGLGFDSEHKDIIEKKVGKPFEETSLEQLAAVVMAQMARRDIFIFDVEIEEYVKRPISFKQSKDGKGIVLKGKRFSIDETARLVVEDIQEEQSHELSVVSDEIVDKLYSQPNISISPKREISAPVNQKKVLYWVYFEPYIYQQEAESRKLKFSTGKKYAVHKVVPHPLGKLDQQQIVVTDDLGRAIKIDEKFFTTAGQGLVGGFNDTSVKQTNDVKLMYEDELRIDVPKIQTVEKVDPSVFNVPDLRPGKKF